VNIDGGYIWVFRDCYSLIDRAEGGDVEDSGIYIVSTTVCMHVVKSSLIGNLIVGKTVLVS